MNAGCGGVGVNIHLIAGEALDSRADCVLSAIILGDYCVAGGNNLVMFRGTENNRVCLGGVSTHTPPGNPESYLPDLSPIPSAGRFPIAEPEAGPLAFGRFRGGKRTQHQEDRGAPPLPAPLFNPHGNAVIQTQT